MQFGKKLSSTQFIFSQVTILLIGLAFLGGLFYVLYIQDQKPTSLFSNGPITTPPKTLRLDLDQPDDNSLTFQSSIIISGQTTPNIPVLISQDTDDLVIQSKIDGSFSTVLTLNEGINNITTTVFDSAGTSKSIAKTVYYSKEKI